MQSTAHGVTKSWTLSTVTFTFNVLDIIKLSLNVSVQSSVMRSRARRAGTPIVRQGSDSPNCSHTSLLREALAAFLPVASPACGAAGPAGMEK